MSPPKSFGRTIPFRPYTPEDLEQARRQFPEEKLASRALEKYAYANCYGRSSNRWFWKDNHSYTCGEDVVYHQIWVPRTREVRCPYNYKKYLIPLGGPPTLSQIDTPKPQRLSKLLTHRSETGWNLSRDHPRHLLNFPQEILDSIFGFTLSTQDHTIIPDVSTSNLVHKYRDSKFHQSYTLGGLTSEYLTSSYTPDVGTLGLSTIIHERRYDSQGKYFVLRRVCRDPIDATILRVCKSIGDQGNKFLYTGNEFEFLTTKTGKLGAPDSLVEDVLYPNSSSMRAFCQGRDDPEAIDVRQKIAQDAIIIIENRTPVLDLDFDIHQDLFVRFLRAIGPSKAAMIKTLRFAGPIKEHHCSQVSSCTKIRKYCQDDIIESLLLYITLIKRFCTNLQKLVITIWKDRDTSDNYRSNPTQFDRDERETHSYARLQNLLETQIRGLSTVQHLQVYENIQEKVECAKATEEWFSERTRQRGLKALEKAKLESRMQALDIGDDNASSSVETPV
ncbi:hypothetical protein BOTCAL_0087g00040 [Botryotinia calthae]|uniref:Uncharacterized protein n=1 Tax=Botryotinia calthae TaxID=38488 RepID=A0A4Y8D7A5_9HELO|nr:hypothetical protein BOTCAL_0087g00040 [Botryotinia calthae]